MINDPTPIAGRPVVVGVDGSPESLQAETVAALLASSLQSTLVIVHALGLLEHYDDALDGADAHRAEVHELLEHEWSAPARSAMVRHETRLVEGPALLALPHEADKVDASMVVVGARGAGGLSVLGSTSLQLVREAHRPVLVVPGCGLRL
jgi:nucleotide-binding universal stress UspA family protein